MLIVATALLLVSCGGLTAAKGETGVVSFSMNPAMITNMARNNGQENPASIKIKFQITSPDNTTLNCTETKTIPSGSSGSMPSEVTTTFSNLPLNVTLNLKVEVYSIYSTKEELTWTAKEAFTLSKVGETPISATFLPVLNTDYFIYNNMGSTSNVVIGSRNSNLLYFTDADIIPGGTTDHIEGLTIPRHRNGFCSDFNKVVWYIDDDYNVQTLRGNTIENGGTQTHSVLYDSETMMMWLITHTASGWYAGKIPAAERIRGYDNPESELYDLSTITSTGIHLAANPFSATTDVVYAPENSLRFPIAYVYDDCLYSLRTFDQNATAPSVTLCKFSLTSGALLNTATVSIPVVNGAATTRQYDFNDLFVSEDTILVLFHQVEIWGNDGSQKAYYLDACYGNQEEIPEDIGYIDRGGIQLYKASNLAYSRTIGMTPVQNTISTPAFTGSSYEGYNLVYTDASLSPESQKIITYNVKWAVAPKNGTMLANPQKIIAIKPKKLVIADSGNFFYSTGGEVTYEGKKYASPTEYTTKTSNASNMIEIDLESFAVSEPVTSFRENGSGAVFLYEKSSGFSLNYNHSPDESNPLYGKEISGSGQSIYFPEDNLTKTRFAYTGDITTYNSSSYPISALVQFGSENN